MKYPMLRFFQSRLGRLVEHALWRWGAYHRFTGRLLFRELDRMPGWKEGVARGMADADAGRTYRWNRDDPDAPMVPSEAWKADDPQQPDGWHHDGTAWVLNDTGWYQDPYGHWRYNHPGDPGWREKADGSWEYIKAVG